MLKYKYRFTKLSDIETKNFYVYETTENGGGYYIEHFDEEEWKDTGMIFHSIMEVINHVHRWWGWKEAAKMKREINSRIAS